MTSPVSKSREVVLTEHMWKDLQENQDVFGSATPHSTHRQVTSPGDVGLGVLQNILQDSYLRRHRMGSEQRTPTTILIIHSLYPIEKRVRVTQDTGFKHLRAFVRRWEIFRGLNGAGRR